ncbi:MAG: hypothetical protein ACKVZH_22340 [Blastocatellia bacterium]
MTKYIPSTQWQFLDEMPREFAACAQFGNTHLAAISNGVIVVTHIARNQLSQQASQSVAKDNVNAPSQQAHSQPVNFGSYLSFARAIPEKIMPRAIYAHNCLGKAGTQIDRFPGKTERPFFP